MGEYAKIVRIRPYLFMILYCSARAVENAGPCRFFDPPRSGTAIIHYSFFSFQYSLRRGRFVKRPYNAAFVPSVSSML